MKLAAIGRKASILNLSAGFGETVERHDRVLRISFQGRGPKRRRQLPLAEIRQQGFAVGGAIQRHQLTGLAGDGDHVAGGGMIDKQRMLPSRTARCAVSLVRLASKFS